MPDNDIDCGHVHETTVGGRRLAMGNHKIRPLVSIVTVVFRARNELLSLIENVLSLRDENIEFIIIDGGSDDGTHEILCKYDSEIDYWASGPDHGIYDAMNKGIAAAQGTFILHLNAGDRLLQIPISELQAARDQGVDAVAFRVAIPGRREFRPSYGFSLRFNNTLHHQGTFFRKQSLPVYDTKYKVFADFDVNQKLALQRARVMIFDRVVASHAPDGVSDIPTRATISEFFHVIANNYGKAHLPIAWILCKWRGLMSRVERLYL